MYKRKFAAVLVLLSLTGSMSLLAADELKINDSDSIENVLSSQVGKHVSITLESGKELAGLVKSVTKDLTHLTELTGKEFYDAVIVTNQIEAVVIRTK